MKIISLFSGCGGLDTGFEKAGFDVIWANEYDKSIWDTYKANFTETKLDTRSIRDIPSSEIPDNAIGIIGGPPCQSFSEAGKGRGINDKRGQLFFEYIRIIKDKKPLFFLAENVSGMLHSKHKNTVDFIIKSFSDLGYTVNFQLVNANDYDVPQDRKRVFFVGYKNNVTNKKFNIIHSLKKRLVLKDAIYDLRNTAKKAKEGNKTNGNNLDIPNHEYMTGGFSSMYMSRNRVRSWDEPSFTIQAGGRHAPIHPQAPKMEFVEKDKREFVRGKEDLYRRLSIRECARIQTFPDEFVFKYSSLVDGYKMIGNAVPVNLAFNFARQIRKDLFFEESVEMFKKAS